MNPDNWKYEDHWPKDYSTFNLNTISGAIESGVDLFLLGSFGGFGGCVHYVHSDLEKAKEHAKANNDKGKTYWKIFRMKIDLENA